MPASSPSEACKRLEVAEAALKRARGECEALMSALPDPRLTSWVDGRGRVAPRQLTAIEVATIKRVETLRKQVALLEAEEAEAFDDVVEAVAGREPADDPETLLWAALRALALAYKAGHKTTEARVILRALADYLKSLDIDP